MTLRLGEAMGEQTVESNISSVTVFRSGALVTRVATLPKLEEEQVRLVALPLSLDDATVKCRVVVPAGEASKDGNSPIAADIKVTLGAPGLIDKEVHPEAQELKELRLTIKQLRARARILREGLDYQLELGNRAQSEKGQPPIASPLEARLALLGFAEKHHHSLYDEHHAAQEKIEVAQRRLDELEVAEQRASSAGRADPSELTKSAVVTLQGKTSEKLQLELQYFVPGACWAPAYGLRIGGSLASAELTMRALVSQRSGEDWTGAQVTLSTAQVQRWAEVPELKSKRIGRRQQQSPKRGWRPAPVGSDELYRDYDNSFGVQAVPVAIGGAVTEPVLFGGMPSGEVTSNYPAASMVTDDLSSFDEEEHTAEILESSLATPPPAMAPKKMKMRSPGRARTREMTRSETAKEASFEMAPDELWEEGYGRAGGGGGAPGRAEPVLSDAAKASSFNESLLDYANLRMGGAGTLERGTLHLTTKTRLYFEYLTEQGVKADDDLCEHLLMQADIARENAMDIAALPSGHSLAWAEDYDYAYRAESHLDLASDGQFHSVPVMAGKASCKSQHVVVPRESTDVFRTLVMQNCFAAPLLPGPMDVYWNEDFLLTSQLGLTAPSGEVQLGLGVDQSVKVVRNTNYREDTTGLMGGSLQLTHKIGIDVVNNGPREIDLRIQERIPVASSDADDIKVTIKSVSPEWSKYEPEPESAHIDALQGGYQWQLSLPAGERKEFAASYEIRLPSKFELRGGNRREW